MKERIFKTVIMLAAFFAAGIVYYLIPDGIRIKCPVFEITGFYCPGCGVTRMCLNLIDLKFYEAFRSNCGVFVCMPFLAVFFGIRWYGWIKTGKPSYSTPMKIMVWTMIVILLIFGIMRNIPYFYFLRP